VWPGASAPSSSCSSHTFRRPAPHQASIVTSQDQASASASIASDKRRCAPITLAVTSVLGELFGLAGVEPNHDLGLAKRSVKRMRRGPKDAVNIQYSAELARNFGHHT